MKNVRNTRMGQSVTNKATRLLLMVVVFMSAVLLSERASAQSLACNYSVHHSIDNCTADVTVDFYDGNGLCSSTSLTNMAAHTPYAFNCGGCGTLTNIVVTLNAVGGFGLPLGNTGIVDSMNTNDSGTTNSPCNTNSGNYYMQWNNNLTNISN
jgi:hypothetical protein